MTARVIRYDYDQLTDQAFEHLQHEGVHFVRLLRRSVSTALLAMTGRYIGLKRQEHTIFAKIPASRAGKPSKTPLNTNNYPEKIIGNLERCFTFAVQIYFT